MDLSKLPIFGTEIRKLVRKNDPDTSHESAKSVNTVSLEQKVFEAIQSYGEKGCISDDLLAKFNHLPYSSVTARYRALMIKKLIEDTGERRNGRSGKPQRVMRAIYDSKSI